MSAAKENRIWFGTTAGGNEPVELLALDNGKISCGIITYGAAIQSLCVPDREGKLIDVVLGYDTLEEYERRGGYLGAVVGRVAGRIRGAGFRHNGVEYALTANRAPNHIHGGAVGFSHRVWTVEELSMERAVLSLHSPDGEEGYPGSLTVRVTYALEEAALTLTYEARTDRDTPCSLTNHSYFNLNGAGSGLVLDQQVRLFAGSYTPTDAAGISLGTVEPVEGTPLDFRAYTAIGARIGEAFQPLQQVGGYDHNWVADGQPGQLRRVACARSVASGIMLQVDSTMPGIQFYTGNFLDEGLTGKGGADYPRRSGFCFETQFYPNAVNEPAFPSPILKAGETGRYVTRFSFDMF